MKKIYPYLYTKEDDLSTRSLNIIKDLGGISSLLVYYKIHGSFLNIRKSGARTNIELTSLCEYLISHKHSNSIAENPSASGEDSPLEINLELIHSLYLLEKDLLAFRTRNVLSSLEEMNNYFSGQEQKKLFFEKYFLANYDFNQLAKVGRNSIRELTQLTRVIRFYILNESNSKLRETLLFKQLSQLFNNKYNSKDIQTLMDGDKYNFLKCLCVLINSVRIDQKKNQILKYYLFDNNAYPIKELANKIECSYELIRITINFIHNEFILNQINLLRTSINAEAYDLSNYDENFYVDIPNIKHFEFYGLPVTPNAIFSKIYYRLILKDRFVLIDEILSEVTTEIKAFNFAQCNVFIKHGFVSKTHLVQLLQFLNTEIYNFESVGFDYDLKILITRFYKENALDDLSRVEIDTLHRIILRIKESELLIDKMNLKRIEKKERINHILEIAEKLIKEIGTPLKTQALLTAINAAGLNIDTPQLLHKLGKNKSTFVRLGNSLWGLKGYHQIQELSGSLREIVEDILLKRDTPIHISELVSIMEKMRPISLKSLNTNLRASDTKMFKFFNCSFIGLSTKKYDQYWYDIPRFKPAFLKKEQKLLSRGGNYNNLIERMYEIYGYPKIHLKYLLSKQNINEII